MFPIIISLLSYIPIILIPFIILIKPGYGNNIKGMCVLMVTWSVLEVEFIGYEQQINTN